MKTLRALCALAAITCASSGSVSAAIIFDGTFAGVYAPANWTFTTGGNGTVNTGGAPGSILLTGSDNGNMVGALTAYVITTGSSGDVMFSWTYTTFDRDGSTFDPAGYIINGTLHQFTANGQPTGSTQSNWASFGVNAGDTFGFFVDSSDNLYGPGQLTISNTPEPGSFALLGSGMAAVWMLSRRRK